MTLQKTISDLHADWCAALLSAQVHAPQSPERHGGLHCPDCERIHGRCADALYPFLRMGRETGEEKYLFAAQAVFAWAENNVSQPDGSYVNDLDGINSWAGITVFAVIAYAEALHYYGGDLPETFRARLSARVERAARWIQGVDWAERGTINYLLSAAAALASASRALDQPDLLASARHWAAWATDYFLPDGILFGEGARLPTPRGVWAVDPLYNLEESLPNLMLYAEIAGDAAVRGIALRSFAAHLDFLLPDGFYDAGWGSRSFKWTLWGSRTSDGIAGLLPYAHHDPRIAEAVRRNVGALRACTTDGLLYGGPHLRAHGRNPCLHHTFCHAKALTTALDAGSILEVREELPIHAPRGIDLRASLGTTFVALGDWRASFTVSDVLYHKRGLRPSGGAITMLWHAAVGPVCVSSMSVYERLEGGNMATARSERDIAILTPRIEQEDGAFSSLFDETAALTHTADSVRAEGRLTNLHGEIAGAFSLKTRFTGDQVHFQVQAHGENAVFILPIVSPEGEAIHWSDHQIKIIKPRARLVVESDCAITGEPTRIFHFVPGVQAARLAIEIPRGGASVTVTVSEIGE